MSTPVSGGDASSAIAAAGSATEYKAVVQADRPAAYFKLDDELTQMADSGPRAIRGNYGAAVRHDGAAITTDGARSAVFPGGQGYDSGGYGSTRVDPALQGSRITLEAWIKLNSVNTTSHDLPIAVYGTVARGVRYGLLIHGMGKNNPVLLYQAQNTNRRPLYLVGHSGLAPGVAYHVVAVADGTHVTTYINGLRESTVVYPGSIDYSAPFYDGLQIGGANQIYRYASASFSGSIAQVAVYDYALSQGQVTHHFLTGQLMPMVTERPGQADEFVDSIGVNAHFDNPHFTYAVRFPEVKSLLVASGIRHLREAMVFNNEPYINMMKELAAANIHASYLTQLGFNRDQIRQFPAMVGPSFEQYEAPNEQDDVGNPNWYSQCLDFQRNLYSWVKSDPAVSRFPVLGPALAWMPSILAVGDQSRFLDYGNIHDYFNVFNPGTPGWGRVYPPFGAYGSVGYNANLGHVTARSKSLMATESGYGTIGGDPHTLDPRSHLRYMTRLFFTQYNAGIARTYSYELIDRGGSTKYVFNYFGLLKNDLQPKPAYYGLKSIISALSDPGSRFSTTPLGIKISGFNNNVRHTLLQKRNGEYIMAIWLEVPSWVTLNDAGGDIVNPTQNVTLTTSKAFGTAIISTMDENGSFTSRQWPMAGSQLPISVSDKITLIRFGR